MRTDEVAKLLLSNKFARDGATGAWLNREKRKHIRYEAFADKSIEWLRGILAETVPPGEFWFYSHYAEEPSTLDQLAVKIGLNGLMPVARPSALRPARESPVVPDSRDQPGASLAMGESAMGLPHSRVKLG